MNGWGVVAVLAVLGITGCQPAAAVGAPKEAPAQKETEAPARKTAEAPAQKTPYRDTALGLSFEHDPGLRVRPCDEAAGSRCVILFDPATEPFLRDLLTIQVHNGALETVAAEEAGFVRNAEGRLMTTFGRFEPVAVETVHVGGRIP